MGLPRRRRSGLDAGTEGAGRAGVSAATIIFAPASGAPGAALGRASRAVTGISLSGPARAGSKRGGMIGTAACGVAELGGGAGGGGERRGTQPTTSSPRTSIQRRCFAGTNCLLAMAGRWRSAVPLAASPMETRASARRLRCRGQLFPGSENGRTYNSSSAKKQVQTSKSFGSCRSEWPSDSAEFRICREKRFLCPGAEPTPRSRSADQSGFQKRTPAVNIRLMNCRSAKFCVCSTSIQE